MAEVINEQKQWTSEFAIASLVVGVVSFVQIFNMEKAIVAIVFGILALRRIKAHPEVKGKKIAVAGVTIGAAYLVLAVVMVIAFWPQFLAMIENLKISQ